MTNTNTCLFLVCVGSGLLVFNGYGYVPSSGSTCVGTLPVFSVTTSPGRPLHIGLGLELLCSLLGFTPFLIYFLFPFSLS